MADFAAGQADLDYDPLSQEIYLYHGSNCFRRWEIKRSGFIEPGKGNYSYFCTRRLDALAYARAASARDVANVGLNSLVGEPVILKVKFNARTWLQVDFIENIAPHDDAHTAGLSLAVLGPIPAINIVDILLCNHGRKFGGSSEAIRTFADGTFLTSIYQLKETLMKERADAWMLKQLGTFSQTMQVNLTGGQMPDLSEQDNLRRLRQVRA